jgi:hypothetical protein
MDFIGEIVREPDPPAIDCRRWNDLIREHPHLVPPEAHEATSPFTKTRMVIKSPPDVARVVVDGREVGTMSWSPDDSNMINVFGELEVVVPLAHEIARSLGGRFQQVASDKRQETRERRRGPP